MHAYPSYDAPHWRQRAQEFRDLAASIDGADAKSSMLKIADHYDQLAASVIGKPSAHAVLSAAMKIRSVPAGWPA